MKPTRALVLIAAALVVSGCFLFSDGRPGSAQQTAPPVLAVGVVDIPEVFRASNEIKALKDQFGKQLDRLKREAEDRNEQTKKLAADLDPAQPNPLFKPDSKDYREKQKELLHRTIENRVWWEESNKEMQARHLSRTEDFYETVMDVIRRIGRDKGLQVVLYKETYRVEADTPEGLLEKIQLRKVLYNSPVADLTPLVIEKLNAEYRGPADATSP